MFAGSAILARISETASQPLIFSRQKHFVDSRLLLYRWCNTVWNDKVCNPRAQNSVGDPRFHYLNVGHAWFFSKLAYPSKQVLFLVSWPLCFWEIWYYENRTLFILTTIVFSIASTLLATWKTSKPARHSDQWQSLPACILSLWAVNSVDRNRGTLKLQKADFPYIILSHNT